MNLKEKLKSDYALVFGKTWPVWVGGVAIGVINVFMFMFYQPWSTLDGVLNWGDWSLHLAGIRATNALSPLLRTGSVVNIGLIAGAFLSALLSKQFGVRVGPVRELVKGAIGGVLIGIGAVLVRGCNIGGFFSGTSALGMHGLMMALGLTIGAFFGARFLMWEMMRGVGSSDSSGSSSEAKPSRLPAFLTNRDYQPYFALVIILVFVGAVLIYIRDGNYLQGVILLFGGLLGIISQRSRLCFVHAFREPFLTGDASHTKAMLLALVISIIGFSIVKADTFNDKTLDFVRATFWQGSLVGGIIFGFGMTIAGGCGGGMMWRVGEGHVKLWMALIGYVTAAAFFDDWLVDSGTINKLGQTVFLPDVVGWGWALVSMGVLILLWYLLVQWNEYTHRFAAI